jgi:uncharacterized protein (TIGR02145 family)
LFGDHTNDGSGIGTFASNLTGLTPETPYYIRAYATNSVGTAYGNELTFTTLPSSFTCGEQVTYEGKTYNTVEIGTQCWFQENLNAGTKLNGTQASTNNGIIEKYCYNDLESNCDIYGGLYDWNELMQYVTTEGVQGICPSGWHVPTIGEFTDLSTYLGGNDVTGGKIKEAGYAHWAPPNTGATNESGYTALPAGYKSSSDSFYGITELAYIYSSTQYNENLARYWRLTCASAGVQSNYDFKFYCYSVRCLKD